MFFVNLFLFCFYKRQFKTRNPDGHKHIPYLKELNLDPSEEEMTYDACIRLPQNGNGIHLCRSVAYWARKIPNWNWSVLGKSKNVTYNQKREILKKMLTSQNELEE